MRALEFRVSAGQVGIPIPTPLPDRQRQDPESKSRAQRETLGVPEWIHSGGNGPPADPARLIGKTPQNEPPERLNTPATALKQARIPTPHGRIALFAHKAAEPPVVSGRPVG